MNISDLKPAEILEYTEITAETKASSSIIRLVILGVLAGAFIALAAQGSNIAAFNLLLESHTYGLGRTLAGVVFPTGLMLVIIGGGELFTGNILMLTAIPGRRIKYSAMLRNWGIVYVSNFIGAIIIAALIYYSNQLMGAEGMIGASALRTAVSKVNLGFTQALFLGILCNWLVCMAVWMAYGAKTLTGKILCIFFPVWLFITSGFEHSIANMYYIPIGILAKNKPDIIEASGLTDAALDSLNRTSFFVENLIPVTLGNIIGGGIFVALAYYLAYRHHRS